MLKCLLVASPKLVYIALLELPISLAKAQMWNPIYMYLQLQCIPRSNAKQTSLRSGSFWGTQVKHPGFVRVPWLSRASFEWIVFLLRLQHLSNQRF